MPFQSTIYFIEIYSINLNNFECNFGTTYRKIFKHISNKHCDMSCKLKSVIQVYQLSDYSPRNTVSLEIQTPENFTKKFVCQSGISWSILCFSGVKDVKDVKLHVTFAQINCFVFTAACNCIFCSKLK